MTLAMCERDVRVMRATPKDDAGEWRRMAYGLPGSRLAHAFEWAGVVRQAYGHRPLYLAAVDEQGHSALLPAVIVRRPFFGTVVASMPFLDGGGPCSSSPALATALVTTLMREAARVGARHVEIRSAQKLNLATVPLEHKVNMVLPLPDDPQLLWTGLDRTVRNQVRKAERSGLSVETGGAEHLDAFYTIYSSRMRDLGSPPHDRAFFRAALNQFAARARVLLVRKGGATIGGLIAIAFKDALVVPWASCLTAHLQLCPNMLLYWEAIRGACAQGLRSFDFGRSTRGSGTFRFKRQWGAVETPLYWYSMPVGSRQAPAPSATPSQGGSRLVEIWRHLPLGLTRTVGPLVRRYLIQ
jgi:FemAB-related protein (PEP-CTERM system-associated)